MKRKRELKPPHHWLPPCPQGSAPAWFVHGALTGEQSLPPFPCRNLHAEVTEMVMVELGSNLLTLSPLCVSAPWEPPLPQLGDSSQWSAVSSLVTKGSYSHTMFPVRKSFCGHSWRACQRPRFWPSAPTTWQQCTVGPHGVSLSGAVLRQDGLNRFMALSPPSRHTGQGAPALRQFASSLPQGLRLCPIYRCPGNLGDKEVNSH